MPTPLGRLLRRRFRRHFWRWRVLRRGRRAWRGQRAWRRVQVAGTDAADERQTTPDAQNDRHAPGAVQLRLEEARVDLLQLVDALNVVQLGAGSSAGGSLQRRQVLLGDHGRGDRVGLDPVLELTDLGQGEARAPNGGFEGVVEHDQRRDGEVDHPQHHGDVDEDAEQAVDASDRLEAMKGSADRAADGAHDDGQDDRQEDAEHRGQVGELLHLAGVLVVEAADDQQRAEEEDLRHQRLDHAALVADDQRDHQKQQYGDVTVSYT